MRVISHPQTQHLQIIVCFKAQDKNEVKAGPTGLKPMITVFLSLLHYLIHGSLPLLLADQTLRYQSQSQRSKHGEQVMAAQKLSE